MAIGLALLSALLLGSADFVGGLAAKRASALIVVTWSNSVGLCAALLALLLMPTELSAADFGWALAAGLCGSVGAGLLYRALALGAMSVVAPTTAACAALIPVVVGLARGERLTPLAIGGLACAVIASVLLSRGRPDSSARGRELRFALILAVLAGVSFGGFLVLLAQTSGEAGLWPVVIARIAALSVLLALVGARRQSLRLDPGTRTLGVTAGLLDMGANVAFLLAVGQGPLAVTGLLASLSPLGTVLLARLLLKEKLAGPQRVGTALAMSSVVLLALR